MTIIPQSLINIVGVCDKDDFPSLEQNAFTQISTYEKIKLPEDNPDIEYILSVIIEPEILNLKLIETPIGNADSGLNLTGWKLIIEGQINQSITYSAQVEDGSQPVFVLNNNLLFSSFIVIPQIAVDNEITADDIDQINVELCIEDAFIKLINSRKVFKNLTILINATSPLFEPTEVCNCKVNGNLNRPQQGGSGQARLTLTDICADCTVEGSQVEYLNTLPGSSTIEDFFLEEGISGTITSVICNDQLNQATILGIIDEVTVDGNTENNCNFTIELTDNTPPTKDQFRVIIICNDTEIHDSGILEATGQSLAIEDCP